jgi:hypothetical protein
MRLKELFSKIAVTSHEVAVALQVSDQIALNMMGGLAAPTKTQAMQLEAWFGLSRHALYAAELEPVAMPRSSPYRLGRGDDIIHRAARRPRAVQSESDAETESIPIEAVDVEELNSDI